MKPSTGVVKINVDAALFPDKERFSFACIARNDQGHVLEAIACSNQGMPSPESVEAMGVKEALSWIKRKDWQHVTIETDCLTVIQALRSSLSMDSYFGGIISDCKSIWDTRDTSIVFIKRSANSAAHALARASCFVADRVIRSTDLSPEFVDVLLKDIS